MPGRMVPEDHSSFKVHEASYQGRYEEVKEKVLNNNRLLTSLDDVSAGYYCSLMQTVSSTVCHKV